MSVVFLTFYLVCEDVSSIMMETGSQ